jgi:hypothetical protein
MRLLGETFTFVLQGQRQLGSIAFQKQRVQRGHQGPQVILHFHSRAASNTMGLCERQMLELVSAHESLVSGE